MHSPGLTFGRYLLVERIAAGGMGEVYVALQTGIGRFTRPLAVKLLLPHLADDARVVAMFLDEARVGAQLSHANIAQVYDVGQDHQRYFIAMELVRGVSLSGLISALQGSREQLSAEVLAYVGRSLAEGLHVAHEQKGVGGQALELIHRDVTPHNILVSVDGAVKLTDFGIAHVADADRHSRPGLVLGKLGYLAPEQILGKPLDRRVDLFAAGATLFHLATLERPFDTPTGAVLDPQRLPTVPLRVLRPDLPRPLVDAIEKALENDVARRFSSAKELRNALPVAPPEAAEELGALVRRLCAESLDALEAKTERATRAVLNQQLPETQPGRAAVQRNEQQTSSVPQQLATPPAASAPAKKRFPAAAAAAAVVALLGVGAAVFGLAGRSEPTRRGQATPADQPPSPTPPGNATGADPLLPPTAPEGPTARAEAAAPTTPTGRTTSADPPLPPTTPAGPTARAEAASPTTPTGRTTSADPPLPPTTPAGPTTRAHAAAPTKATGRTTGADLTPLAAPAVVVAPPAAPGTLTVDAAPWGEVEVDGRRVGETPLAGLKLSPGTHQLVVRNPDTGKSARRAVTISAGKPVALKVDLR